MSATAVPGARRVTVVAVPAVPGGRLSDGVVVKGHIVARLFGMKLLRVEADVVLLPAGVRPATALDIGPRDRPRRDRDGGDGDRRPRRLPAAGRRGGRLRDAHRLLAETDEVLRRSRAGG